MCMSMKRINVHLTPRQIWYLRQRSRVEKVSAAAVVRRLIGEEMKRKDKR